jgi:hypothetical protein
MSLNSTILSVTRRTVKGFTVGEIFDRVFQRALNTGATIPAYSTVRARVYELASSGRLANNGFRADRSTGRTASTFVRNS